MERATIHKVYSFHDDSSGLVSSRVSQCRSSSFPSLFKDLCENPSLHGGYLIARKYDLAIQELREVVARYPEGAVGYHLLGVAYEQKGLFREAISAHEQCVKISRGDPLYLATLGHAYAIFGRRQDAERILAELQHRAKREYVSPFNVALVWLGIGNRKEALAWLEKAYIDRSFSLVIINAISSLSGCVPEQGGRLG